MPVNYVAKYLSYVSTNQLICGAIVILGVYVLKAWTGGRRNTWERDWTGKMILIVAPPSPVILSLIHHLLHLPQPPQILFLPPFASPLPEDLLTIIHTLRLSAESNHLAQLHCEPLPRTPAAVADFTRKWGTGLKGTISESGRRVDAVVLGDGWEVSSAPIPSPPSAQSEEKGAEGKGIKAAPAQSTDGIGKSWSTPQFQFHLLTSLLPFLLRAPAERSIRLVTLISPGWAAALPSLQNTPLKDTPVTISGLRGLTMLLVVRHFQLILDTLAKAAYRKEAETSVPVPDPNADMAGTMPGKGEKGKKGEEGLKSNVLGVSVIMPWTREEVIRGAVGADESTLGLLSYILFYPILIFLTPSPARAIHSILFALSAPIRYPGSQAKGEEDPKSAAVSGGDVVRNCQVVDLPPVMLEPGLARANYEALEREVEMRIKAEKGKSG